MKASLTILSPDSTPVQFPTSLISVRLQKLLTFGYLSLPFLTFDYLPSPLDTFPYLWLLLFTFPSLSGPYFCIHGRQAKRQTNYTITDITTYWADKTWTTATQNNQMKSFQIITLPPHMQ